MSPAQGTESARDLLRSGAAAMRHRAIPQAETLADVLGSQSVTDSDETLIPDYPEVVVVAPRRCGKTTSIQDVLVGRMIALPDYRIFTTAQTGLKASARWSEVADVLERFDPHGETWDVRRGAGKERITNLDTGATWCTVAPRGENFRSEAADCVWVDEAQEFTNEEETADLESGIEPTMDTTARAQLIVSGTPKLRTGMLWAALQRGRAGETGIVEYAAAEREDPDDEAVWWRRHPGIGTLTTIERMRARRTKLGRDMFAREYLCVWPSADALRMIPVQRWHAGLAKRAPARPRRYGLAFEVAADASLAAVVAAWRDEDGAPWVELLAHRSGAGWLPAFVADVARRYRLPISFDAVGQNLGIAEALTRARPRPRLDPFSTRQMIAAYPSFVADLLAGKVRHIDQPDLAAAIAVAAPRKLLNGTTLWSREAGGPAISPLIAANVALSAYDALPQLVAASDVAVLT